MSLVPAFGYGFEQHGGLLSEACRANHADDAPPVVDIGNTQQISDFTWHLPVEDYFPALRVPKTALGIWWEESLAYACE